MEVVGEAGLTFRTGDADELVRQLARILDDPALAARLAQSARQRALEFCDLHSMLEAHARVYREALR